MVFRTKRQLFFIAFFLLISSHIVASSCYISDIYIYGNKRTKPHIILKELPFAVGATIDKEHLNRKIQIAQENLTNTSFFNYINISYLIDSSYIAPGASYKCTINIIVEERWYYWPLINVKLEDRNLSSWLKEMDFGRITFGLGLKVENLWGLGHDLSVSSSMGFEKGAQLSYNNLYLDKKGVHSMGILAYALFNKTTNVSSKYNQPIYIKGNKDFMSQNIGGSISYTFRPEVRIRHSISLGFCNTTINDSVLLENKDYWGTTKLKNTKYNIAYSYAFEQRNYAVYPTQGYYIGVTGQGEAGDNFNVLYGKVAANLQYYLKLGKRWFWAADIKAATSFKNKDAYIYDMAIGYSDINISGYDLYVADGQHFATLCNNVKFLILPKKIITINWLNWLSKFNKIHFTIYGKAGIDMGYVYNNNSNPYNTFSNTFLCGANMGIDILTYYDIVLRISYAMNKDGNGGFFFGIKSPIF